MARTSGDGRRRFLQRAGAIGALAVIGPLSGCGGKKDEAGDGNRAGSRGRANAAAGDEAVSGDPCADLSGLTPEQKSFREDAGYVAASPVPAERCDTCEYWEAPRPGARCGGCTAIAGPIHPGGTCDLWEAAS